MSICRHTSDSKLVKQPTRKELILQVVVIPVSFLANSSLVLGSASVLVTTCTGMVQFLQLLHILSCLPLVLSMNLLSSVTRTGCR